MRPRRRRFRWYEYRDWWFSPSVLFHWYLFNGCGNFTHTRHWRQV